MHRNNTINFFSLHQEILQVYKSFPMNTSLCREIAHFSNDSCYRASSQCGRALEAVDAALLPLQLTWGAIALWATLKGCYHLVSVVKRRAKKIVTTATTNSSINSFQESELLQLRSLKAKPAPLGEEVIRVGDQVVTATAIAIHIIYLSVFVELLKPALCGELGHECKNAFPDAMKTCGSLVAGAEEIVTDVVLDII